MLTVSDVAERLGVSAALIYELTAQRRLVCYRIGLGRGAIRFTEADVQAYLDSCRHGRLPDDWPERCDPEVQHE